MWYFIGGIVVFISVALIITTAKADKERNKIKRLFGKTGADNFKYQWFSFNLQENVMPYSAIAIDDVNKEIVIVQDKEYKYKFDDIRSVEIIMDEEESISKSTLSTLGKATVGGVLLGGVGAVTGAASGKSKVLKKIKKLDLKIKTSNLDKPSHTINFFDSSVVLGGGKGVNKNDQFYKKSVLSLEEWYERFNIIREVNN